jgi:hypothetical protein
MTGGIWAPADIQDKSKERNPVQTKVKVLSDGSYKSESLGGKEFLKQGEYVADVTLPFAFTQSEAIRRIIGDKGQNLKGPLVETKAKINGVDNPFGSTVTVERRFSVP